MGFEVGAVVNDSPVDCQSRERPRRAVRAASHNPVIRTNKRGTALVVVPFLFWRLTRMQNPLREDVIELSVT